MSSAGKFDLVAKWQDGCVERIRDLVARGFYFSKSDNLKRALGSQNPLPDEIIDQLVAKYYNFVTRVPEKVCRTVRVCKSVTCPPDLKSGFELLKSELEQGRDLLPRMSRKAKDLDCCDGMLNDWNIQHFHLGVGMDSTHPGLIQGTSGIAYVYMTGTDAYVIAIGSHGKWASQKLLEDLLESYPAALNDWKTPFIDVSYELDEAQRLKVRACHVNSMIKINGIVYMNPNGGEMMDGSMSRGVIKMLRTRQFLRTLTKDVGDMLKKHSKWGGNELETSRLVSFSNYQNKWQVVLEKRDGSDRIMVTQDYIFQLNVSIGGE